MTGTEKLRKENQALRKEIQDLKNKLKKIADVQKNTQQILNSENNYIDTPTLIKKVKLAKNVEK